MTRSACPDPPSCASRSPILFIFTQLEETLGLPPSQALALFNKAVRRLHGLLRSAKEAEVERSLPRPAMAAAAAAAAALAPHERGLDEELDEAAAVSAAAGCLCCRCCCRCCMTSVCTSHLPTLFTASPPTHP